MRINHNSTNLIAMACEMMLREPVDTVMNFVTGKGVMEISKAGPDRFAIVAPDGATEITDHDGLGLAILTMGY